MKIQVRQGVFETNSSSVHSLSIINKSIYNRWKDGEICIKFDKKDSDYECSGNHWIYELSWETCEISEQDKKNLEIIEKEIKKESNWLKTFETRTYEKSFEEELINSLPIYVSKEEWEKDNKESIKYTKRVINKLNNLKNDFIKYSKIFHEQGNYGNIYEDTLEDIIKSSEQGCYLTFNEAYKLYFTRDNDFETELFLEQGDNVIVGGYGHD